MGDKQATLGFVGKPDRISARPLTSEYYIKLWGDIEEPESFSDELDLINGAQPGDVVVLDICTGGGDGDTAALFARALLNSQAHTVAVIGPTCASAGSIIALSCREWVLDDTSALMIHTASYGVLGKDVDIMEHAVFARKHLQRLFAKVYTGFLNEEELADVIKGTPIYFLAEELEQRLIALAEFRAGHEEEIEMVSEKITEPPKRKRKPKKEA